MGRWITVTMMKSRLLWLDTGTQWTDARIEELIDLCQAEIEAELQDYFSQDIASYDDSSCLKLLQLGLLYRTAAEINMVQYGSTPGSKMKNNQGINYEEKYKEWLNSIKRKPLDITGKDKDLFVV